METVLTCWECHNEKEKKGREKGRAGLFERMENQRRLWLKGWTIGDNWREDLDWKDGQSESQKTRGWNVHWSLLVLWQSWESETKLNSVLVWKRDNVWKRVNVLRQALAFESLCTAGEAWTVQARATGERRRCDRQAQTEDEATGGECQFWPCNTPKHL